MAGFSLRFFGPLFALQHSGAAALNLSSAQAKPAAGIYTGSDVARPPAAEPKTAAEEAAQLSLALERSAQTYQEQARREELSAVPLEAKVEELVTMFPSLSVEQARSVLLNEVANQDFAQAVDILVERTALAERRDTQLVFGKDGTLRKKVAENLDPCAIRRLALTGNAQLPTGDNLTRELNDLPFPIRLQVNGSVSRQLNVRRTDTVDDIKDQIKSVLPHLGRCELTLSFNGNVLSDRERTVGSYDIREGSELQLQHVYSVAASSMQIFVRNLANDGYNTFVLEVQATDTVESLQQRLWNRTGLPPKSAHIGKPGVHTFQSLRFGGNVLEAARTLSDYNIQKETTLTLAVTFGSAVGPARV